MTSADDERLDVLQVTEACSAGVRRHLELILPALAERGLRCGLFAFSNRSDADFITLRERLVSSGCPVEWMEIRGRLSPATLWQARLRLQSMLRQYRPCCLHLHAGWAGLLGRMLLSAPSGTRVLYSPHAFGFHDGQPFWRKALLPRLEKALAKKTDGYILVGKDELAEAKQLGLPEAKLFVAENALPEDFAQQLLTRGKARRELGIASAEHAVLVPCRLAWQKGLDVLLAALAKSPLPEPTPIFYICGEGPERSALQALAGKLGLLPRLRFCGNIPLLWQKLPAFDQAILPSRYEGRSYALLECLAAGLPVLASDIPANQIYDQILTFQAGQSDSLAAQLPQLWTRKPRSTEIFSGTTLSNQIDQLLQAYFRGQGAGRRAILVT
jgi:glycosyltransferase involved in cell wall biosynthesis